MTPEVASAVRELGRCQPRAIVMGASAGAIDALDELLPDLPAATPAPIVVVVHVPADRPSVLPDLFAPRCTVRVAVANDKEPLESGTVYFAPPDYHLLIERAATLALSLDPPVRYSRPSIDVLFESAAWALAPAVLGIVLSGANDDGARGLAAIVEHGGCAWVQAPDSAVIPVMPEAAIARARPSHVLPPRDMAAAIAAWANLAMRGRP